MVIVDYNVIEDNLYYYEVSPEYLKAFIWQLEKRKKQQDELNKHIENVSKNLTEEERKELAKLIELVRQQS